MFEQKSLTPDNVVTLEMEGAIVTIREFFEGTDTLNDIITRRILQDVNPSIPSGENA